MLENNDADFACPICEGVTKHYLAVENWGEMRRCLSCGFVFVNPMSLPESPESLFGRAYKGKEVASRMDDFHKRLLFLEDIRQAHVNPDRFVSYVHRSTIDVIKASLAPGSVVLDIGCGYGAFLGILQRLGYKTYGLEVAKEVVEMLQREGYQVWHGTVESIPPDWVTPDVITSFYVMHHLTDPIGTLKTIRAKFPKAILVMTEFDDLKEGARVPMDSAVPPRTLSWWGKQPLRLAMEKAGYAVNLVTPMPSAGDFALNYDVPPYFMLRRNWKWATVQLLSIYYKVKPLVSGLFAPIHYIRGWRGSITAIGHPR